MKRLEYAQQIPDSGDTFHNVIFSDECSVSLEQYRRTCYRKVDEPLKRKPNPKHSLKVHVWAGISRNGATKVCIFDDIIDAELYCRTYSGDNPSTIYQSDATRPQIYVG